MRRPAMMYGVCCLLTAGANAQVGTAEIQYNSVVSVTEIIDPDTDERVTTSDTIAGAGFMPFSLDHSVSYDDPLLDFDPSASSRFSVDSVQFVRTTPLGDAYYDVTISGELSRAGTHFSTSPHFSRATSDLVVDLIGFRSGSSTFTSIEQYEMSVSYSSNYNFPTVPMALPTVTLSGVNQNGTLTELESLKTSGTSQSDVWNGNATGDFSAVRLQVRSDPLEILVPHPGITTVEFEGTFRILTDIPAPTTASAVLAGLVLTARRRR